MFRHLFRVLKLFLSLSFNKYSFFVLKMVTVDPDWNSFIEMEENNGRYIYENSFTNDGWGIGIIIALYMYQIKKYYLLN